MTTKYHSLAFLMVLPVALVACGQSRPQAVPPTKTENASNEDRPTAPVDKADDTEPFRVDRNPVTGDTTSYWNFTPRELPLPYVSNCQFQVEHSSDDLKCVRLFVDVMSRSSIGFRANDIKTAHGYPMTWRIGQDRGSVFGSYFKEPTAKWFTYDNGLIRSQFQYWYDSYGIEEKTVYASWAQNPLVKAALAGTTDVAIEIAPNVYLADADWNVFARGIRTVNAYIRKQKLVSHRKPAGKQQDEWLPQIEGRWSGTVDAPMIGKRFDAEFTVQDDGTADGWQLDFVVERVSRQRGLDGLLAPGGEVTPPEQFYDQFPMPIGTLLASGAEGPFEFRRSLMDGTVVSAAGEVTRSGSRRISGLTFRFPKRDGVAVTVEIDRAADKPMRLRVRSTGGPFGDMIELDAEFRVRTD